MSLEAWNNGGKEETDRIITSIIKVFQDQPLYRRIRLAFVNYI